MQEELKILQDANNNSGDETAAPGVKSPPNRQYYRSIVENLHKRLDSCKVKDLNPQSPTVVKSNENLYAVISKMIKKQYTKLIVIDNDNTFSGTVDALDLIGEIYENDTD